MTDAVECPVCHCTINRNAPPPPPANAGNKNVKYDFSTLEVGDSMTLPLSQNSVASRLAKWRAAKHRPERRQRLFTTRHIDANTTTVWRTK